jgi:hypothetical protein
MKKRFLTLFYCSFLALNILWTMSPDQCENWECNVELIDELEEESEVPDSKRHARSISHPITHHDKF